MATSYWFLFSLLSVLFLYASSTPHTIPSIGSNQLKFWAENVVNDMPQSLSSKLSPMSKSVSEYYTSLVSKPTFSFDAKSCSVANMFCVSETDSERGSLIQAAGKEYSAKIYAAKVPDQAKNYPQKIPDQVKYYATKIPDQVKYYASKTPEKVKIYATSHSSDLGEVSFFRLSILKPGNTVHLDNLQFPFPHRSFLPSQIASKISITSNELQRLFPKTFSSPVTKDTTKHTILNCNAQSLKGEEKKCAKSLEEMVDFAKTVLGNNHLTALTTKSEEGSGEKLRIEKLHRMDAQKSVSCHEIFLPFATYFCHVLSSTRLYSVDLVNPNTNAHVNTALVVCHMDTSSWPADHVAFQMLKFSPGDGEACHWMSQADLVWIGA